MAKCEACGDGLSKQAEDYPGCRHPNPIPIAVLKGKADEKKRLGSGSLDREGTLASHNFPCLGSDPPIADQVGMRMQSYGRANVPRYGQQGITDGEVSRIRGIQNKMLLALQKGFRLRHVRKPCSFVNRSFGGHRLVPKVQAEPTIGLADNACKQHGRDLEIQVRKRMTIARVPKKRSARAALPVIHLSEEAEGGTSADYDGGRSEVLIL